MSQFRKKTQGQTEWWTEGRMDRPYFKGPFRPRPRVQQHLERHESAFDCVCSIITAINLPFQKKEIIFSTFTGKISLKKEQVVMK